MIQRDGVGEGGRGVRDWEHVYTVVDSCCCVAKPIQYTNAYIWNLERNDDPVCETAKETQMYRTVFWTLWERERVG